MYTFRRKHIINSIAYHKHDSTFPFCGLKTAGQISQDLQAFENFFVERKINIDLIKNRFLVEKAVFRGLR